MPKKPNQTNPKCPFCYGQSVKNGKRIIKLRTYQRYLCKACKKYFTPQPLLQASKTYNLKTILNTISNYNLGTPIRKLGLPKSTIHNWIKNINLPMNRLRNKLKHIPTHNIIKKQRFIHHKQPFLYQYHNLKLEFTKKFPGLTEYLTNLNLPKSIFNNSKRISQASKETSTMAGGAGDAPSGVPHSLCEAKARPIVVEVSELKTKQNYAVQLAKLAAAITKDNKQRHNIIENFMLINDTATIATEIPVYLKEEETNQNNLTGHIDILQLRFHKLHILDYKPEPVNKQQTINQLILYRKVLSKRTNIKKHKFKLAFFNENCYYEIN